jgi:hypothetical protein
MFTTYPDLTNRNLLSSVRRKAVNVFLSSDEELNLLAKDNLVVRKDIVVIRHVEIFGSWRRGVDSRRRRRRTQLLSAKHTLGNGCEKASWGHRGRWPGWMLFGHQGRTSESSG